jgi:hypothetical protein
MKRAMLVTTAVLLVIFAVKASASPVNTPTHPAAQKTILITPPLSTRGPAKGKPIIVGSAIGSVQPAVVFTTVPLSYGVHSSDTTPSGNIPPVVTRDDGSVRPSYPL